MIAIRTDKYTIEMDPNGCILLSVGPKDGKVVEPLTPQEGQEMVEDLGTVIDYASEYRKKKGLSQL